MDSVAHSLILRSLGICLANSLWQLAVLWVFYLLLTSAGRRFTASARHFIGVVVLSAGCIWFFISFCIRVFYPDYRLNILNLPDIRLWSQLHSVLFVDRVSIVLDQILPYFSSIYLAVLFFLFIRYVASYFSSKQLKTSGLLKADASLRIFASELVERLEIRRKVSLWFSSLAESPMTIGFFRSVILVPVSVINHLSIPQTEAILLHELAHIKRNDYLLNLFLTAAGVLFYFNPFARLFVETIAREREHSCDDLVLQFRYDPHTYASALLSLEKARAYHGLAMAATGHSGRILFDRIRRITGHKPQRATSGLGLAGFILFAGLLFISRSRPLTTEPVPAITVKNHPAFQKDETVNQVIFTAVSARSSNKKKTARSRALQPQLRDDRSEYHAEKDATITDYQLVTTKSVDEDAREYSLLQIAPQAKRDEDESSLNTYPYVPPASFTYSTNDDTIDDVSGLQSEVLDHMPDETLHSAIIELNGTVNDHKKTDKTVAVTYGLSGRMNATKISGLKQHRTNLEAPLNQVEVLRLNEAIQLQLAALRNTKLKTDEEAMALKARIAAQQNKLYLDQLHKLQRNINDIRALRKKNKIIYI